MPRTTGAHLFVRCLRAEGVDTVFTLVGDHILPLCDAAADAGVRFVDTRHESAAVHMADGFARVTGRPGVAWATGGPGHANSIAGLTVAWASETPVVHVSGAPDSGQREMLAFQEIPQVEMAAPVTKGAWTVPDARRIPEYVARAFRTALSGRPGPVHLTLPIDVQEQEVAEEDVLPYHPHLTRPQGRTPGDPALVREAVRLLHGAERPAVIVGGAARFSLDPEALRRFAEVARLPVFTVELARGLLDDDHPLCFGYADPGLNEAARLYGKADVVLVLGKRFDSRIGYGRPPTLSAAARVIQVDPSPTEVGRNREVAVGLAADIGAVVEQMAAEAATLRWQERRTWLEELRAARRGQRERLEALAGDDAPMHPLRVYREVESLLREDDVLVLDGGDYVQWGRGFLRARGAGRWLRLGNLAHLGCGLPFALAAKVALPQARVWLFTGDGSVGFYAMELDTAVRHGLPFVAVLGNDQAWGIDRGFQLEYYGRAVATDLRWVPYERVVEALGGYGEAVERPEDLGPALRRALEAGRPALVNVRVRWHPSPMAAAMVARHRREEAARRAR